MQITSKNLQAFADYLRREEKSENTLNKYLRDAAAFLAFVRGKPVSKELVIRYKQHLIAAGYAVRSINSMLSAVNSLLSFSGLPECRVKTIRQQRQIFCSEDKELTQDEYRKLVQTAKQSGSERLSLVLQTICCTGIRVGELQFVTVEAAKNGETAVYSKGKIRTIIFVKELQKRLLRYAAEQKISNGMIFVTKSGKPLDRTAIWRGMKELCSKTNVNPQKVFPHNLRHLFAREFYGQEKDIVKLADVLGHSSIDTTRIYVVSSGSEHREKLERMHLVT